MSPSQSQLQGCFFDGCAWRGRVESKVVVVTLLTYVRHTISHPSLFWSSEKNTCWQCKGSSNESGCTFLFLCVEVCHAQSEPITLNVGKSHLPWGPIPFELQHCWAMIWIIKFQYFLCVPNMLCCSFNRLPIVNPPSKLLCKGRYQTRVPCYKSALLSPTWVHSKHLFPLTFLSTFICSYCGLKRHLSRHIPILSDGAPFCGNDIDITSFLCYCWEDCTSNTYMASRFYTKPYSTCSSFLWLVRRTPSRHGSRHGALWMTNACA